MLSISHTLTGAFIATKLSHPALFIPLTLASHYFEDWIPHRDVGTGLSSGRQTKRRAVILELVELAISIGLIWFFWQRTSAVFEWQIWLASFVALVPDFVEAPRNFWDWEPWFLKPFNDFHQQFHHSTFNYLIGVGPQVLLVVLILLLK